MPNRRGYRCGPCRRGNVAACKVAYRKHGCASVNAKGSGQTLTQALGGQRTAKARLAFRGTVA